MGTKVFTIATGYDGALSTIATGLVPATRNSGRVDQDDEVCFPFVVPAGAKMLRVQLFNSETEGGAASDLDLDGCTADRPRSVPPAVLRPTNS